MAPIVLTAYRLRGVFVALLAPSYQTLPVSPGVRRAPLVSPNPATAAFPSAKSVPTSLPAPNALRDPL